MNVTVLVGGVGGARFLTGLRKLLDIAPGSDIDPDAPHRITAIVNVGDDVWMHGLRICPDLDTCMYTLGDGIDTERGWGRKAETWNAKEELAAYGADPDWFGLGDRDIATHLIRTRMLRTGYPLSAVTEALCTRWKPGVTLLPASDDRSETHVVITDPADGNQRAIHFEEWWVRHRAQVPTTALPTSAQTKQDPHRVSSTPSNPPTWSFSRRRTLSSASARSSPFLASAAHYGRRRRRSSACPPVVGGMPLRGMADACLDVIGVDTTAEAVGRHYGARSGTGILDGWLVHSTDDADVPGVQVRSVPLLMSDPDATAEMARAALELAGVQL